MNTEGSSILLEIKPKEGFGSLRFGDYNYKVLDVVGAPEEIEDMEDMDNSDLGLHTILWSYYRNRFTLCFEGQENSTISSFGTDNKESVLFGKRIFDLSEAQIIELMKSHGFQDIEIKQEIWGERRVSFKDGLINFYFEHGELVTVNWGIFMNTSGNMALMNYNINFPE